MTKLVKRFLHDCRAGTSNRFGTIDYDPQKVYSYTKMVANNPMFFTLVAERNGKLVGVIHAEMMEYLFSTQRFTADHIFYVVPEVSSARIVTTFVRAYLTWAEEMGAVEAILATSTGIRSEGFAKMAKRFGFEHNIAGFTRRL